MTLTETKRMGLGVEGRNPPLTSARHHGQLAVILSLKLRSYIWCSLAILFLGMCALEKLRSGRMQLCVTVLFLQQAWKEPS